MSNRPIITKVRMERMEQGTRREAEDTVACESPLTIRIAGREYATLVATPDDLEDLVLGFLASEGVIRRLADVVRLDIDADTGFANVELAHSVPDELWHPSKRWIGSCCGVSRQFYLRQDVRTARTILTRTQVSSEKCFTLMDALQKHSHDFHLTGGLHNAAICSTDEILACRTDIGRHNTLDKLYGAWLKAPFPLHDKLIAFSGRLSSEVVLKTAKIGIGILLTKSAPTDLALELAHDLGITAVGFIRGSSMNIYTHPERIV